MLNRVLKNFGRVLGGRGAAAVCAATATGLMANALPPEQFGLVILLHTYVMVVKGLLNFRSFEAIVRFGVPLQEAGDEAGLRRLLQATALIDALSTLAAAAIGVLAVPLAGRLLHWDGVILQWAPWYALLLLTTPVNTPSGILRLYDRFDALAVQYAVAPAVRVALVALAWASDAGMPAFLLAWGLAFGCGNLYMIVRGLRELKARTAMWLGQSLGWRSLTDQGGEFWRFIGVLYWQTNIDLLPKHVSTLLAGALLGPAAAGLFRLAREMSTVLTQPAVLLREVLFPDLMRAWHAGSAGFASLLRRTAIVAGGAGLTVVALALFAGRPLLTLIGEDYLLAQPLLLLLLLGAAFDLAGAPLRAAAYATGRAGSLLRVHLVGVGVYTALFFVLTRSMGLTGPGWAAILSSLLIFALSARLVAGARGS